MRKIKLLLLKNFLLFIPIFLISFFVLWPSFHLALTGDDFLGLWRYHYYLDGHTTGSWNNLNFFFTDYGPQDTITAIIHSFFGFNPLPYYIVSYLLRLTAGLSFIPLVSYITKNKKVAIFCAIFFTVCTTGLETTDWSFNMPSYIAISFLNLFLIAYLQGRENPSLKYYLSSALLLYITIISQPIRTTFLPGLIVIFELYTLIRKHSMENIKQSVIRVMLFGLVAVFIYVSGSIGNSVGAGETLQARLNGGWKKVIANNFSSLIPHLKKGEYQLLFYPIAQFGAVIVPTNVIPDTYQELTPTKALWKLSLPLLLLYILVTYFITTIEPPLSKKVQYSFWLFGVMWTSVVYLVFSFYAQFQLSKSQYITMLIGGYTLLSLLYIFIKKFRNQKLTDYLILAVLLSILSFLTPWFRDPTFLLISTTRYLIIPAAGLTILLCILLTITKIKPQKNYLYVAAGFLLLLHIFTTSSYLSHLAEVRDSEKTEKIRKSVPYVKDFGNVKKPLVFYFEPAGSEMLHHSLLFGFPVIMGDQYNFFNVWTMMYTDRWEEVQAAYTNGSSFKRFSIPTKKVPLESIYSFRLDNDTLVNTTMDTRRRLKELQNQQYPSTH